jgi:hypothetical protein
LKYFSAKLDLSPEVRHNSFDFKLHSQYFKKGTLLNLTSLKICNLHVEISLQYLFSITVSLFDCIRVQSYVTVTGNPGSGKGQQWDM